MPKTIPAFPHIPIAGGLGAVPAWGRPDLFITAPGGIGAATPAHSVLSAGATASMASQDINVSSQRHTAIAVKAGMSLFTYGKAQDPKKRNAETGLQLHAASGKVSVRAQDNTLSLMASKAVSVASTTSAITLSAPKHVLLNGGGSSLRITTGNITLTTQGPALFKAAMRELAPGASASAQYTAMPHSEFAVAMQLRNADGKPLRNRKVRVTRQNGARQLVQLDASGRTHQVDTGKAIEGIKIELAGQEQWAIMDEHHHHDSASACDDCHAAPGIIEEDHDSEEA
jgi:uncharacterized protein (DUF2345 family)